MFWNIFGLLLSDPNHNPSHLFIFNFSPETVEKFVMVSQAFNSDISSFSVKVIPSAYNEM